MDSFEQELKATFLQEAQALLDEAEGDCLALAQGVHSTEVLQRLFRLAHTFKGSARAAGFDALSDLAHQFEEILDKITHGSLNVTPVVCSKILKIIDSFKLLVKGLTQDLTYELPGFAELLKESAHIEERANPSDPPPPIEQAASVGTMTEQVPQPPPFPQASQAPQGPEVPQVPVLKTPIRKAQWKKDEPKTSPAGDMIRISALKLDLLINMVGELKVHRQVLTNDKGTQMDGSTASWGTGYIDKIINEVHDLAMALRMTPIRPVFQKMQRVVWDSGTVLGKEIQFVTLGEEVELDKVIVDKIGDALVHLIRNAIDHGIEPPEERTLKGKPPQGTITLQAQVQESQVLLSVSDDGYGLNREKILKKGLETGLIQATRNWSHNEIYNLIFEPGFSTRSEITDISGRGVGMNVVKQLVEEVGGSIDIETKTGKGTRFILVLPLILSVIQGLVVELSGRKYIIPLSQILETVDLEKVSIERKYDQSAIFNLRGEVIPILSLDQLLHGGQSGRRSAVSQKEEKRKRGLGIIVGTRGRKITFEVEHIIDSQPMALKPLGPELEDMVGIAAGAILGDGEPVLVLDLQELIPEGRTHGV